jgi:hypothetical protein
VRKPDLFKLIAEYRRLSVEDPPMIVGSQAFHASSDTIPDIALRSVECDFLLSSVNFSKRPQLDTQLGALSDYQVANGFFADVLGLATVVLAEGWRDRLVPLLDDNGTLIAMCADPYDVCTAKLIAGREKDLEFLESALTSDLIDIGTLLDRVDLVKNKVENDVVHDWLEKLASYLLTKRIHSQVIQSIKAFSVR